jgi:SAM-dependent methyltransferase
MTKKKKCDDFKWEKYTQEYYEEEMCDLMNGSRGIHKHDMLANNVAEEEGELVFEDDLHENWKEIYHQVHKLRVKSVFECGCGPAQHLINIHKTSPNVIVNGCDYSQSQIDLGYKYYNLSEYDFSERLTVKDLTNSSGLDQLGTHEFVYTQAVIMHLAYKRAIKFLLNIKNLSTQYIFLIENTTCHDFDKLLAKTLPEFERVDGENKYCPRAILLKKAA